MKFNTGSKGVVVNVVNGGPGSGPHPGGGGSSDAKALARAAYEKHNGPGNLDSSDINQRVGSDSRSHVKAAFDASVAAEKAGTVQAHSKALFAHERAIQKYNMGGGMN